MIRLAIRNSDSLFSTTRSQWSLCDLLDRPAATAARFLKCAASRRWTGLRVARTDEELVNCDHRGASDDGDGCHHESSFEHGSSLDRFNTKTPDESCSGKARELQGRADDKLRVTRRAAAM